MIGLQKVVVAMTMTVKRNPTHGTFSQRKFFRNVARKADTCHHRVLEPRSERRSSFVEIASRIIFFERRGPHGGAVNFDRSSRGIAGNSQFLSERRRWENE